MLDIDDHFDAACMAASNCALFNAHYDEHGFSADRGVRRRRPPGRRRAAPGQTAERARNCALAAPPDRARPRANWPRVEILLRADSHYCAPGGAALLPRQQVDYVLGVATTPTLAPPRRRVWSRALPSASPPVGRRQEVRRFKEFYDGAGSWDRVERIIARVEAGPEGVDTRFIVTSLAGGSPRIVYQRIYCQRGQTENHIKAFKPHLAADRTSCHTASANQMRLFLHAGAYWIMWTLRAAMPRRSSWRRMQFDTLRLLVVNLVVRVVELKQQVRLHLPACTPDQAIFALVLGRLPRLIC